MRFLRVGFCCLCTATLVAGACTIDFRRFDPRLGEEGGSGGAGARGGGGSATMATGGSGGEATGGGGTGGGGGQPAPSCGTVEVAADDFDDGAVSNLWWETASGGATLAETGGERVIALPENAVSWGGFSTIPLMDLRDGRVFVEVPTMVDTSTTANAFLHVVFDSENYVLIGQRKGRLLLAQYLDDTWGELANVEYDPAKHRWWQLREEAGKIHWETSADGQTFTSHAVRDTSMVFSMDLVQIELGASTEGGEVAPGEVHFDNLIGGPTEGAGWCPAATLEDDFDDSVQSRMWSWLSYEGGGCNHAEQNGQLVLSLDGDTPIDCAYYASQRVDLTGSSLLVEVPKVPTEPHAYNFFRADVDPSNGVAFVATEGQLQFRSELSGSTQVLSSVPFDPNEHGWWRLRESGGSVLWETAPDGATWTKRAESAVPIDLTALNVVLGAGIDDAQQTLDDVAFDNLNAAP